MNTKQHRTALLVAIRELMDEHALSGSALNGAHSVSVQCDQNGVVTLELGGLPTLPFFMKLAKLAEVPLASIRTTQKEYSSGCDTCGYGMGSLFIVRLPLNAPPCPVHDEVPSEPSRFQSKDSVRRPVEPGWRMGGAPTGVPVLVFQETGRISIAKWERFQNSTGWHQGLGTFLLNVTHWMPLPEGPSTKEGGQ